MVLVFRDQTKERSTERSLRQSEETYRLLFHNAPIGLIHFNEQGIITACNDAFVKIIGSSQQALIGLNMLKLPDKKVAAAVQDVINGRTAFYEDEYHSVTADKKTFVKAVFTLIRSDDAGWFGGLGIIEDISERKQAEAKNKLLSSIIEQGLNEVYIFDAETLKFTYANAATLKNTGYGLDELKDMTPLDIKPLLTAESFDNMIAPLRSGDKQSVIFETLHRRKNGETYDIFISLQLIKTDRPYFVAIGMDISGQKQLEAQLRQAQKMESVGRLAGGIAHDFNNMLQAIFGYSDMALGSINNTERLLSCIKEIQAAAHRSADLTRQLLAFAKKQAAAPKIINLNKAIYDMEKMLKRLIGENIELILRLDEDVCNVHIDPSQLDQVIANLIVNARDAITGTGTIAIDGKNIRLDEAYCAMHKEASPGDYCMLSISDTGSGMTKETLGRIFEPFFTTKKAGKGTGLGLSTVYGIIKQNNGFINVYSEPGKGATFKIYLPRSEKRPEDTDEKHDQLTSGGVETILLVEDEEQILDLCQTIFKDFGYKVLAAKGPGEALRLCQGFEEKIDLLITDVVMPTMNGKELSEKIAALKPGIKTIFMSGYTADIIAKQGLIKEDMNFIQKPFSIKDMTKKIREVLNG